MDEFVRDMLTQWNMCDLIQDLKDAKVDKEAFERLTYPVISTLVPKLGTRAKFLNKFNNFKNSESRSPYSVIMRLKTQKGSPPNANKPAISQEQNGLSSPEKYSNVQKKISESSTDFYLHGFKNSGLNQISNNNANGQDDISDELKKILAQSETWKSVFTGYDVVFTLAQRDTLTKIVTKHLMKKYQGRIQHEVLKLWSQAIAARFPLEKAINYFRIVFDSDNRMRPHGKLFDCYSNTRARYSLATTEKLSTPAEPITKSPTLPAQNKPKFEDSLMNILLMHKRTMSLVGSPELIRKKDKDLVALTIIKHLLKDNPSRKMSYPELKHWAMQIVNLFPSETLPTYFTQEPGPKRGKLVNCYFYMKKKISAKNALEELKKTKCIKDATENWNCAFEERKKILISEPIQGYFDLFPFLRQESGYKLLIGDFNMMHPDKLNSIGENWPEFSKKIVRLAKEKNLIEAYDESLMVKYTEMISNYAFILLPLLLEYPLNPLTTKYSPTPVSISQNFIILAANITEAFELLQARIQLIKKHDLTCFAVVVAIGDSPAEIEKAYIFIDGVNYQFPTLLDAVATCLKLNVALNIKHCDVTGYPWVFLQKYVMGIDPSNADVYGSALSKLYAALYMKEEI